MKKTACILALLAGVAYASTEKPRLKYVDPSMPCRRKAAVPILGNSASTLTPVNDIPENWIWNNINGVSYLTNIKNQHIPQYCGSCWAQAATSSLSDRIKIARNASWPDINISPQVVISCSQFDDGCHGGEAISAYQFMHTHEVTDETCAIYRARGHDNGISCSNITVCRNCNPNEPCFVPDTYHVYGVDQYGALTGEDNMIQEIYQRGPIACGIAVPADLENYTTGIYQDLTGDTSIVHDISIVGFGVEDGVKFWTVRNSWGTHWGESGFVRVIRGVNNIAIESDCAWATPKDTWTSVVLHETTVAEKNDPNNDFNNPPMPQPELSFLSAKTKGTCKRVPKALFAEQGEVRTREMSWETVDADSIPTALDWRNVNGTNYCSWNTNQHIPQYCGSCWAQGTTSALADRFNILTNNQNPSPIALNPQVIVNCQAGGSCNGGDPSGVYAYAYTNGIPDSSCEQYTATNLVGGKCQPIDLCRDCTWPPPAINETGQEACWAVDFKHYYVSDYYSFSGAAAMKAELVKYGPISCGMDVTDKFETYAGGIYSEKKAFPLINHEISIVGYGVEPVTGTEYWIGRNSWGTYWGERGFFKMQMHSDNLAIEKDCTAGIPSFSANVAAAPSAVEFTQ